MTTTATRLLRRGSRGEDVRQVQAELNRLPAHVVPTTEPRLVEDGIFGQKTWDRVVLFQKKKPGLKVDGLVGPNTLDALAETLARQPAAAPAAQPTTPEATDAGDGDPMTPTSPDAPKEIPPKDFGMIHGGNGGSWGVNVMGYESPVREGQRWQLGPLGDRIILEVMDGAAIFWVAGGGQKRHGKVFIQTKRGFGQDVRSSVPMSAGADSKGSVLMAETMARFGLGVVAGSHIAGAALVLSLDALRFYVQNQALIDALTKSFQTMLDTRARLKQTAPETWDRIFYDMLFSYAGATGRNLGAFAGDPRRVAQIVGAIAGGLGSKAMKGRVNAVGVAVVCLIEIAKGSGIHAGMNPDIEREKRRIITTLRNEGSHLTDRELEVIVAEVEANASVLQREFEKVNRAMSGLGP